MCKRIWYPACWPPALPARVSQRQWVVHHIGIAVVRLQVARCLNHEVGTDEPAHHRIIHAPVHVHQPHLVHHFVTGVAVVHVRTGQCIARVCRPIQVAPFAPDVVGQILDESSTAIRDVHDGAQVILVVVLGYGGGYRNAVRCRGGDDLAEHEAARIQVVLVFDGPRKRAACGKVFLLEMQAGVVARAEYHDLGAVRQVFPRAFVVGVVDEAGGGTGGGIGDGIDHVIRPPADRAPRPAGHVAVGVIGIGGVGHPVDRTCNPRRGVRTDAACAAGVIGVVGRRAGASGDVRFAGDVADGVIEIAVAVNDRAAGGRGRGNAVESVVGVGFGQPGIAVVACQNVAQHVIAIAHVLDCGAAPYPRLLGRQSIGGRVEGLVGDDAVAIGLLGEVAGCVHGVGRPVDRIRGGGIGDLGEVAVAVVDVLEGEGGTCGNRCADGGCRVGYAGHGSGEDTAIAVVGGGGDVGDDRAVDHSADAGRSAQRVVTVGAAVAVVGTDGGNLADAVRRRVIYPGGIKVGFAPGQHAPQYVICHGAGLALGIRLTDQFAQGVVGVGPGAHVRVGHAGLATPCVIAEGDDISCRVCGLQQVAEGVAGIADDIALGVGDADGPLAVLEGGGALATARNVAATDRHRSLEACVGVAAHQTVRGGLGQRPTQGIVGRGGVLEAG